MLKINQLTLKKLINGKEVRLLDHIDFEMTDGKTIVLLGKSGAGKTSLLRTLAQLEPSYSGSVEYKGQDIQQYSIQQRCRILGYVSQNYNLFPHMTVYQNCAQPLQNVGKEDKSAILEALSRFNLEPLIDRYPSALSGGQKQRIAIIRALLMKPNFILLDEPTSALDPENAQLLIDIIAEYKNQGMGFLIASQDMDFAKRVMEQALFLEKGAILEHSDNEGIGVSMLLKEFLIAAN